MKKHQLLLSLAVCSASHGATIVYSSPVEISADIDVVNTAVVQAIQFSGTAAPLTVNGVAFTQATEAGIAGVVSTVGMGGTVVNTFEPAAIDAAQTGGAAISEDYQSFLQSGMFTGSPGTAAITIEGLSIGQDYQIQFFSHRSEGGRIQTIDGGAGAQTLTLGNPVGDYIIGTFTADATSQSIGTFGGSTFPVYSGYVLSTVPEPTSSLLIALSGLALLRRRR